MCVDLRRRAVELAADIAGDAEECSEEHVERGISHGSDADAAEEEDRRIEHPVGMRSSPTQMPMSGSLRMTSIRLPIHIEAIRPQKRSGLQVIT
jgi:hypothetical protein